MSRIEDLSPTQQDNLLRVHYAAEANAALAGQPFLMSLTDTFEAVEDFGGSLDDGNFLLPLGLVGKW